MRKIIAITQITLDGIMQASGEPGEDPRGGFTQGSWVAAYFEAMGSYLYC